LLTIIFVVHRYTAEWTIQPMITPGKNALVDMDSYLSIVVDEIRDLSTYGMLVRKKGQEVIRCRVHLIMCSGDLVGTMLSKMNKS
jgi:hypothetical protein